MDFNRLTIKSGEAVAAAQELARRRGNPEVYPEQLCIALLDQELPRTLVAVGCPILGMAVLDHWWFQRPMLAHLRHAVPGFDALLPRSRARLPELPVMSWQERWTTLVEYWLLGFAGVAVGAALTLWIALAHGRTSRYVMSDIGATSPGRWHPTHLL